jgi:hypothetical protein
MGKILLPNTKKSAVARQSEAECFPEHHLEDHRQDIETTWSRDIANSPRHDNFDRSDWDGSTTAAEISTKDQDHHAFLLLEDAPVPKPSTLQEQPIHKTVVVHSALLCRKGQTKTAVGARSSDPPHTRTTPALTSKPLLFHNSKRNQDPRHARKKKKLKTRKALMATALFGLLCWLCATWHKTPTALQYSRIKSDKIHLRENFLNVRYIYRKKKTKQTQTQTQEQNNKRTTQKVRDHQQDVAAKQQNTETQTQTQSHPQPKKKQKRSLLRETARREEEIFTHTLEASSTSETLLTAARSHAQELSALEANDYEQYTIRINTWKRNEQLMISVNHHSQCDGVAQIQVVWCDKENAPPQELINHASGKVVMEYHDVNSLNERFNILLEPPTVGVFSLDDDVLRPCMALDSGFFRWTHSPERMVGYDPRVHLEDFGSAIWKVS